MFLKNESYLFSFFIIIFFLFSNKVCSEEKDKTKILNHLYSLKSFSASFIQSDGVNISEGKVTGLLLITLN